jgi:PAS domain S-box-containing protein
MTNPDSDRNPVDEQRAITTEERLRTLIEASPDPIFMKDGNGRWLEVNHAGLELFHLENADYHGKTEEELAEFTPFYKEALLYCRTTDSHAWLRGVLSRDEERVAQPDGMVRTYDVFKIPLFYKDGTRKGLIVLGRDITERKIAEEERDRLLEKEQTARAAAERAEQRASFLAEAGRILSASLNYAATADRLAYLCVPFASDWCAVWSAYPDGSFRLGAIAHVTDLPDDIRDEALALRMEGGATEGLANTIRHGKSALWSSFENAFPAERLATIGSKNPEHLRIVDALGLGSFIAVPLMMHGRMLGALTLGRKPDSAALMSTDLELAESLARHASLALCNARLYKQAQDAIVARDEFLSIASHELRTPCTSLRLGIEVLLRHVRQESMSRMSPAFLERLLVTTDRQSRHLLYLIDRLLDVSRFETGQLDLDVAHVDLLSITNEATNELREEASRGGSDVAVHCDDQVCGQWDRTRISQVITNLLTNAIKYGAGKPIDIRIWSDGLNACFSVEDHGIGIPPEQQERIFGRFERAVSNRHYGGLGLGLYICQQIVEAHGGTIRLVSSGGNGSKFTVMLPKTCASNAKAGAANAAA